jgi:hypothetical protein
MGDDMTFTTFTALSVFLIIAPLADLDASPLPTTHVKTTEKRKLFYSSDT